MYLQVHILVRTNLQTWLDVFQVLSWILVVSEWPMRMLLVPILCTFSNYRFVVLFPDWSMVNGPMREREININKKTCLNDYELCILLFQHRILWYHELSKYHLKLLSNDLPKIKFYLTQIFTQNHEDSFLSYIYSIHWYLLDPFVTPNLTWFLKLIFYES